VGSSIPYSEIKEAIAAAPQKAGRQRVKLCVEEFTLHGATLWFSCKGSKKVSRNLRIAIIDAGMDPIRLNFPPLMEGMRQKLDPDQTLVVMEA
jgi:hypothetical protein